MNKRVAIIGAGGGGDLILSRQCGYYVERTGAEVSYFYPVRNEIFNAFRAIFPDSFQLGECYDNGNRFLKDVELRNILVYTYGHFDEIYYVVPDLLFNNKFAFNYKLYNTTPAAIKSTRVLERVNYGGRPRVHISFATSTEGYLYKNIRSFLVFLSDKLPDYDIDVFTMTEWNGKSIENEDLTGLPNNVNVNEDLHLGDVFESLQSADYFVGTCNGPSHFSYQFGIDRCIVDPQYKKIPWVARWKEDESECVPIDTGAATLASLVELNIRHPQTCMISKEYFINDPSLITDWKTRFLLKTE